MKWCSTKAGILTAWRMILLTGLWIKCSVGAQLYAASLNASSWSTKTLHNISRSNVAIFFTSPMVTMKSGEFRGPDRWYGISGIWLRDYYRVCSYKSTSFFLTRERERERECACVRACARALTSSCQQVIICCSNNCTGKWLAGRSSRLCVVSGRFSSNPTVGKQEPLVGDMLFFKWKFRFIGPSSGKDLCNIDASRRRFLIVCMLRPLVKLAAVAGSTDIALVF
jgi:hypothetical protein